MPSTKPPQPVLSLQLFELAAQRLGMSLELLDPESCLLAEIRSGEQRCLAHASHLPINDALAARMANDKHYTWLLLKRAGLRTPETVRCLDPEVPAQEAFGLAAGAHNALQMAKELGYPLVVKPNRFWGGRLVQISHSREQLEDALQAVWRWDPIAVVQPFLRAGADYRLDFLDGEYLAGYLRKPLQLEGDGRSSILDLAGRQDVRFSDPDLWRRARSFPEWRQSLAPHGWTEETVLPSQHRLTLGEEILNLNRFSIAEALFEVPAPWIDLGRKVARILGLRHLGIDFKAENLRSDPRRAVVLEVNAAPSLVQLYRMGHREEVIQRCMKLLQAVFEES